MQIIMELNVKNLKKSANGLENMRGGRSFVMSNDNSSFPDQFANFPVPVLNLL